MRSLKKQGFVFSLEFALTLSFLIMIVGIGIQITANFVLSAHCDIYRKEAAYIDKALERYAYHNTGVDTSSVQYDESTRRVTYDKTRIYPESLNELGAIKNDYGYINRLVLLATEGTSRTGAYGGDFGKFRYTTATDSNGVMSYHLEVTLPDGQNYVSLGSDK